MFYWKRLSRCRVTALVLSAAAGMALVTIASAGITLSGDTTPAPGQEPSPFRATNFTIGNTSDGTLQVNGGMRLLSLSLVLGVNQNGVGTAIFTGAGTELSRNTFTLVGVSGNGTLAVLDGASVTSSNASLGDGSFGAGTAILSGANSIWRIGNGPNVGATIGNGGSGTLLVLNGASAVSSYFNIGSYAGSRGYVLVAGSGSVFRSSSQYGTFVGWDGVGTLDVTSGARAEILSGMGVGYGTAGSGSVHVAGGTLDMRGSGVYCANSSSFEFSSGVLANVSEFGGKDLVEKGGTVRPGTGQGPWGTMRIDENFVLEQAGRVEFDLAAASAGSFDRLIVDKSATLDGTFTFVLNNYMPSAGDSFDLIDFGSMDASGLTFDFSGAPLRDGLVWDTSAFATSGVISVVGVGVVPEPCVAMSSIAAISILLGGGRRGCFGRIRSLQPNPENFLSLD